MTVIRRAVFIFIDTELLKQLKERNVSLYNFHLPLDNFSEYSTTKPLAGALQIKTLRTFTHYHGGVCGIIGTTECKTVHELQGKYSWEVGHETRLYQYGALEIKDGIVSPCAGGRNDNDVINEGISIHIMGIFVENSYSERSHKLERENKINLLGGHIIRLRSLRALPCAIISQN